MTNDIKHHPDRLRWNNKYTASGTQSFGKAPSDWLINHEALIRDQPIGAALDLACGRGRNSFYLSNLGFDVDALDISDVAINRLKEKIEEESNTSIFPKCTNITTDQLDKNKYQIILNFNFLERQLFSAIQEALVPEGLLIFETFNSDHIDKLGSKMNREYMLKPNELLREFSELRVLHYREAIVFEESQARQKSVSSLVAQKI